MPNADKLRDQMRAVALKTMELSKEECDHRAFLCHTHDDHGKGREHGMLDCAKHLHASASRIAEEAVRAVLEQTMAGNGKPQLAGQVPCAQGVASAESRASAPALATPAAPPASAAEALEDVARRAICSLGSFDRALQDYYQQMLNRALAALAKDKA